MVRLGSPWQNGLLAASEQGAAPVPTMSDGSVVGGVVDAPHGSGLSFSDPDDIAVEVFAPPDREGSAPPITL